MADSLTQRQQYLKRHAALELERSSWLSHWREIADYIQPRRARFQTTDRNRGEKMNDNIINGTPSFSSRVLASGMMAGITSPARPWFRLTTPDASLAEFGAVRQWLYLCEERIRLALQKSNFYNALHSAYGDLGDFGTTSVVMEEDYEDGLRCYTLPIGQYCLANSARLRIDTLYRKISMTVAQVVERFGLDVCSQFVKNQYKNGSVDAWVDVHHIIEPNRKAQPGKAGYKAMPWKSCWFEASNGEGAMDKFLRESGFEEFPVLAPRWQVAGEDVYGSSPGMEALGDARALQLYEKRKAEAVEKIVRPPMGAPSSLRNQHVSLVPGDTTFFDALSPAQRFAPVMEVPPVAVQIIDQSIREHELRIQRAYYADVWLSMLQSDKGQMTAREVAERHEEKMLQLGPVTERLQDELLDPAIDRAFGILLRNGQIPPPPEELQGSDLRVEYVSIMAQAQRLLGISAIERTAAFVGNLAAVVPSVVDKLNTDQMVDEYGLATGIPPELVRSDEEVAAIREARAKQQQQAAQMEQAGAMVQGAKTLSETDMDGDNALRRLVDNLGGVAGAAAGRPR